MTSRTYIFPSAKDQTKNTSNDLDQFDLASSYVISNDRVKGERLLAEVDDNHLIDLVFDDDTTWFERAVDLPEILGDPVEYRSENDDFVIPFGLGKAPMRNPLCA